MPQAESDQTKAQLDSIKQEFHSMMNGPVSAALRARGLKYRVIFGVELPRIVRLSEEIGKSSPLAAALWKESIRECRLMAPMVQPADDFKPDMADLWVETMNYAEEAEACSMYLFSALPYAGTKSFEWIAATGLWQQVCGYQTLARLFGLEHEPNRRAAEEFLDQAEAALHSDNTVVAHSALSALNKFAALSDKCAYRVDKILGLLGVQQ